MNVSGASSCGKGYLVAAKSRKGFFAFALQRIFDFRQLGFVRQYYVVECNPLGGGADLFVGYDAQGNLVSSLFKRFGGNFYGYAGWYSPCLGIEQNIFKARIFVLRSALVGYRHAFRYFFAVGRYLYFYVGGYGSLVDKTYF